MTSDERHAREAGHEPVSVSARVLVLGAAGLTVLVIVSLSVVWGVQRFLAARSPQRTEVVEQPADQPFARTPLVRDQRSQRLRYEAKQRTQLHRYGWNDAPPKTARIPIDRAIELVVKRYRSGADSKSKTETQKGGGP